MTIYSAPTISGYNDTPPSDDGAKTVSNQIKWATHKNKLADPIKTYADAISSATDTAFGKIPFNSTETKSADYTITASDLGYLIACSNTITITLLAAATAGNGFNLAIRNDGSGVITVDGNASETINGNTTVTLNPGDFLLLVSDGSNWYGLLSPSLDGSIIFQGAVSSSKSAASGYTRLTPNYCHITDRGAYGSESSLTVGDDSISAPTGSSATALMIELRLVAAANNSTGYRYFKFTGYSDSGRTKEKCFAQAYLREFSAITAGNAILEIFTNVIIPLDTAGGSAYYTTSIDGGNQSTGYYTIIGYYD